MKNSNKRSPSGSRELNEDLREILEDDTPRVTRSERGPDIFPGMEEMGIGSVTEPDPEEEEALREQRAQMELARRRAKERRRRTHPEEDGKKRKRRSKGPYLFISIACVSLFLMLIGYLVYFNVKLKDDVLNSPYNKRQNSMADRVLRGEIESYDGQTLAYTRTNDDGSEERIYPYYNEYAHVVGYNTHGKSGVESYMNYDLLTSHDNILDQIIGDFKGEKRKGDTVVTTLDSRLQDLAYNALGSYNGAVIVMDAKNGAIRAMVSKPDFDPNTISEAYEEIVSDSSNSQLVNRATQGLYPPGSTFKILTALAYFREHKTFSDFLYTCEGELTVDDYTVHCYNSTAHGEEDFTGAFAHSCNTAFSTIGMELGQKALTNVANDMLFGEKLPFELASSRSRWSLNSDSDTVELVQTAFGQGKTLVTPYHMALIASAIANGGVLKKPFLIDHVESTSGAVVSVTKTSDYTRLMTETEADQLSQLMRAVVTQGSASALDGRSYNAAGKTGSAEYIKSDGTMGTHSWFVGFTDPGQPDLVIAVLAENGGAGSSTAVPIAESILDAYYGG